MCGEDEHGGKAASRQDMSRLDGRDRVEFLVEKVGKRFEKTCRAK
jgi:hypothetical protein